MADLFSPLRLRGVTLRNRIAMSPMCQYTCQNGFANDWHLVHLGGRAVGGAGLVIAEASAVEARGRITPADLGIWKDEHVPPLARIAAFVRQQGACAGIQIAHAGRKASTRVPWEGGAVIPEAEGGWRTVAPSAVPFRPGEPPPAELSRNEIACMVDAFAAAARRAAAAGFELLEIHAAHGYLLHEFLSPLANRRSDEHGGSFENRIRVPLAVAAAVRAAWPEDRPLMVRISACDWAEGGWDLDQSVELARRLRGAGVDAIDCSSGGLVPYAKVELGPGYQVPFAARIRRDAGIATAAVGLITEARQAQAILAGGQADLVLLARELLRDPYFALHARLALGLPADAPVQYARAFPQ